MTHGLPFSKIPRKFPLGNIFIARAAQALNLSDLKAALLRHGEGDWGDLPDEDCAANDQALSAGGRIFSAYHDREGVKFWIITEADRKMTTILLPEEY